MTGHRMVISRLNSWILQLLDGTIFKADPKEMHTLPDVETEYPTGKGLESMSRLLSCMPLFFLLLFLSKPVFADQYDDCLLGCDQAQASCLEQARLTAGNIQEEEDMIAACQKTKENCAQACNDAETQTRTPRQDQSQDQPKGE